MAGDGDEQDLDRDAIARRRNRLIALALSGLAATAIGGCQPVPCLRLAFDAGADAGAPHDGGSDAAPDGGT